MSEQIWWFLARSTGIVAWGVLTVAVVVGLLLSTRIAGKKTQPAWLLDVHRLLGGIAVALVALHLLGLYLDSYVQFGALDLFVPFIASWQPVAVAWGILAFYLLLAVTVSSMMMKRIPRKLWKVIHFSSYGLFWLTAVHGATAGTDAAHPAYVGGSIASIVLVLFLTAYRSATPRWVAKRERALARGAASAEAGAHRTATPAVTPKDPAPANGRVPSHALGRTP